MWPGAEQAPRAPRLPPRLCGPAIIGIPRRSVFSDVDEGRAIDAACFAARGNTTPCPVIHGGRIVGFARGESPFSPRVAFMKVPAQYRMAWNTYNDIIASLAGSSRRWSRYWYKACDTANVAASWYDLWPVTGDPTAGSLAGAANTAIAYSDTSTGALYLGSSVAPLTKYITSTWCAESQNNRAVMLLYDRVLDYQSNAYTATVSQAMTNVAVAARYNGVGLPGMQMTWATDTVHNATASNITTLTYVNNTGATSVMPTTVTVSIVVSGAAPTVTLGSRIVAPATAAQTTTWGAFMPLASGTTGARSVTDYTTSAANTGTFVLALIYPLAYVPLNTANAPAYMNQIFQIGEMPILLPGAAVCVMRYDFTSTSADTVRGVVDVGWG